MKATFANESHDSPAPGIIPEPARVHDQPAVPGVRRGGRSAGRAAGTALGTAPVRTTLRAKLVYVIRGDKYMVDAYPTGVGPGASGTHGRERSESARAAPPAAPAQEAY